jgi:peptide/nickel transport system permease protein
MVGWKYYTRLVRAEVLVAKNAEYVQAAKVLGYSDVRIIIRHILPNVISAAIVFAAADVVMCMLAGASMSFLGLGVQPPTPEWGALIAGGRAYISSAWWMTAFPGLFLVIAGTGFSMLGDGLADILRTKGR